MAAEVTGAAAAAEPKFLLVRGSTSRPKGKYRGVLEGGAGPMDASTVSIFWPERKSVDVVMTTEAFAECQADGEINAIVIREATSAEAAAFRKGEALAKEAISALADVSTDALDREIARRRLTEAQGKKAGRS
jgi:hypothetical protein